MLKKYFSITLLLLICFMNSWAESYHPFGKSKQGFLTSSYAESRGVRYHAGFDFSTDMEQGWPIYTPEDGCVIRIKNTPFSYGKALYYKSSSTTYVFAHLSGWAPSIWKLMYKALKQHEGWSKDLRYNAKKKCPAERSFAKGDIIAYSGKTGIGNPHLHLEYRQKSTVLSGSDYGLKLYDTLSPEVHDIALLTEMQLIWAKHKQNDFYFNLPSNFNLKNSRIMTYLVDYSRTPKENPMSIKSVKATCPNKKVLFQKNYRKLYFGMDVIREDLLWSREADTAGDWHSLSPRYDRDPNFKNSWSLSECFNSSMDSIIKIVIDDFNGNSKKIKLHFQTNKPQELALGPELYIGNQDSTLFSFLSDSWLRIKNSDSILTSTPSYYNNTHKFFRFNNLSKKEKLVLEKSEQIFTKKISTVDSVTWVTSEWEIRVKPKEASISKYLVTQFNKNGDSIVHNELIVHPKGLHIKNKMEVCLKLVNSKAKYKMVYRSEGSRDWNFFTKSYFKDNKICAKMNETRDVALAQDIKAPIIEKVFLSDTSLYLNGKPTKAIGVKIKDDLSGISAAGSTRKPWFYSEYDMTNKTLWIPWYEVKKRKSILAKLRDDLNNTSIWKIQLKDNSFKKLK